MSSNKIKKIHISFSAGETSAWMTYYLLRVKYKDYITPDRIRHLRKIGKDLPTERNYTFFRRNRSAMNILDESKDSKKQVIDDSQIFESESCEIYSNCGDPSNDI